MASTSSKEASLHDRGGSSPGRAAKRLRSAGNDELPPEVWARVLEYAPFQTILSCAATSRSMLHDAIPRLTKLHIDKSSELNLTVAARFRDIRGIYINSLLAATVDDEGDRVISVDLETKVRLLPFLSRFDKLETVYFGGKDEAGNVIERFTPACDYFYEGDQSYPNEGTRDRMLSFIDLVSGAFRCGALPKCLMISGLCCPDSTNHRSSDDCETCLRACKSFPLQSVLRFECQGSSFGNARSGRTYGLDTCLERAQIESIIESRPGGRDMLGSEDRLLRLLGEGRLYQIVSDDMKALHIVKYTEAELDEIESVIQYAEMDVKKLSTHKVSDAIMTSFAADGRDSIPPKGQRYISEESLDYLIDDVGFSIDKEGLSSSLTDLLEYMQPIVQVVVQHNDPEEPYNEEHEAIEMDCLRLIRCFLEIEDNPPQHIVEAIPSLAKCLSGGNDERKMEAASSLKIILKRGTKEHRYMVIDSGAISKFSRLLGSSKDSIVKVTVLALAGIVTDGACDHIDAVVKAMVEVKGIPKLVNLLDSEDVGCVECSLRLLANVANGRAKNVIDAGVLPHLVRLLMSPDQPDIILANCSILLRKLFEFMKSFQKVIDSKLVPRLVEIMETNEAKTSQFSNEYFTIQANLPHIMFNLAAGTSEEIKSLLKEAGYVSALASLVDAPDADIARIAAATIAKIAQGNPKYCKLLVEDFDGIDDLRIQNAAQSMEDLQHFLSLVGRQKHVAFTMLFLDPYTGNYYTTSSSSRKRKACRKRHFWYECTTPFLPSKKTYSAAGGQCTAWNCACDESIRALRGRAMLLGAMFVFPTTEGNEDIDVVGEECFLLPLGPAIDSLKQEVGYTRTFPFHCDVSLSDRWSAFEAILFNEGTKLATYDATVSLLPFYHRTSNEDASPTDYSGWSSSFTACLEGTSLNQSRNDGYLRSVWDLRLVSWMLRPHTTEFQLEFSTFKKGFAHLAPHHQQSPSSDRPIIVQALQEAKNNLELVHSLFPILNKQLADKGLLDAFERVEAPVQSILASMESRGIGLDPDRLKQTKASLESRITELQSQRNSTSLAQTNDDILDLQSLRKSLNKLELNTNKLELNALGAQSRGKDGKNTESRTVYPQWVQTTEMTGTLSCRQPDLQQIMKASREINPRPKRPRHPKSSYVYFCQEMIPKFKAQGLPISGEDMGERWRALTPEEKRPYEEKMVIDRKRHGREMEVYKASRFTPQDVFVVRNQGMCFFACSYSQLEVRILAHLSGDPNLILLFRRDLKMSQKGVIMDLIRWGDSANVKAKNDFFSRYQHVKAWIDGIKGCARRESFVKTISGRKIYLGDKSGYSAEEIEERELNAINAVIKGSAAELAKMAMTNMATNLMRWRDDAADPHGALRPQMLLQIHNGVILEARFNDSDIKQLQAIAKKSFCFNLKVPLPVKYSVGTILGSMMEI